MSASSTSFPHLRPLHEQFGSQSSKHQIRVVPYSAPRISPDDSILSLPALYDSNTSQPVALDNTNTLEHHASQRGLVLRGAVPATPATPDSAVDNKGKGKDPSVGSSRFATPDGIRSPPSNRQTSLSSSPSISSSSPSPWRRARRVINLHPDGTFSIVQQPESLSSRSDSITSPVFSYASPSSSYGRLSSTTFLDDVTSPSLAPVAEQKQEDPLPSSPVQSPADSSATPESPWNYRLSGSVRKVLDEGSEYGLDVCSHSRPLQSQASMPPTSDAASIERNAPAMSLSTKYSFQSSLSGSVLSERTNYRVYNRSSPSAGSANDFVGLDLGSLPPSSSGSNYVFHDNSSVAQSDDRSVPRSDQSEVNFVILGRSRSSSLLTGPRSQLRSEYSQESLVVAPLRPVKLAGVERLLHAKSCSCDSSVTTSSKTTSSRTGSLRSIRSLSNFVHREAPHMMDARFGILSDEEDDNWRLSSHSGPSVPRRNISHMKHWSTTLSTVISEAENGSEPSSRARSPQFTGPRGSGLQSHHSRRFGSLSSSLAGLDETIANATHSRTTSLDRPLAVYTRELVQNHRLIRDHDEHGDGLAELEDMHRRPSRVRHHARLSSFPSDRNLHSSSSSRANSLHRGSLPLWVRLYYGSGERRFPSYKPSRESMSSSSAYGDSQPRNSLLSRSPSVECCATEVNNPRRRPREHVPLESDAFSITPLPQPLLLVARNIKKRTSSIWSPHLLQDRRADRYSIWAPPSHAGCYDTSCVWKRNVQIVLFVVGFLVPFGWMIGALLPLPSKPVLDMVERNHSTSHLDLGLVSRYQMQDFNELRLRNRIKWWRGVNRRMSIFGVLLVGAYVALAIVGAHEQWITNRTYD